MKNLDAFGKPLKKPTRETIESLLNPKPKRIRRGKFNLDKVYRLGTYANVGKKIEKDGLLKPTMTEVVSLVYDAVFNNLNKKQSDQIKKIIHKTDLWAFTGTLYVPENGVYIHDIPEIKDGKPFMEESDLVAKLQKNDPNVRFVPYGYKTGDMTAKELGKNKFVIALVGKKGAEKLAKVAEKYNHTSYLFSYESENVNDPFVNVSSLCSHWAKNNSGLGICMIGCCNDEHGFGLGVHKIK